MRKIYLVITILFICTFYSHAQLNQLSNTEFNQIKINGVSFESISSSEANLSTLRALLGYDLNSAMNETAPFLAKAFWNSNIQFEFEDDSDTGNSYYLTYIDAINSSARFTVKGKTVGMGDHISNLGGNLLTNTTDKGKTRIVFVEETGTATFTFYYSPVSGIISKMGFISY